ncbi:MAG TPA: hypothetical protein VHY58_04330 [Streptosporangiaceae bacterium]|jgi:hypothetical protein|nr:hypothetical protein [Streptosporangiaceae bacterium]
MSQRAAPGRADIVAILAAFGDRSPDSVPEQIGSLELTWLITSIEQTYQVTLEPTDEELAAMTTLSGAAQGFRDLLAGASHG